MKTTHRSIPYVILALSMFAFTRPLMAADDPPVEGRFSFLSPINGAELSSGNGAKLRYYIQPTPQGDHLHVYVDDQKPIIDKDVKDCPCAIDLPALAPGEHTIAVKEATKDHKMTGLQGKIAIKVD